MHKFKTITETKLRLNDHKHVIHAIIHKNYEQISTTFKSDNRQVVNIPKKLVKKMEKRSFKKMSSKEVLYKEILYFPHV